MTPTETLSEALERIIALLEPVTHGWAVEARAIAIYHRQFAAHRLHGEWFAPHPDILAEIERLKEAENG